MPEAKEYASLSGPRPQIPSRRFHHPGRPGGDGAHPAQRHRHGPHRPCLHAHRRARRRQDHDRPHHRPRAELHRRRTARAAPTVDPCGVCDNCKAITEDRHVDVIEMDAASRTGIDDMRELIEGVRYRPVSARYKVYIIDEVHMLSKKAFNALLKTLEEPPPHVKFIFATTEIRKVPVTVLSRCQRFDLKRVPQQVLIDAFRQDRRHREGRDLARGAGAARPRRRRLGARRPLACSTRRSPMAAAWSMPRRCATCWAWPTAAGCSSCSRRPCAAMRRRSWRRWARCTIRAPIRWSSCRTCSSSRTG